MTYSNNSYQAREAQREVQLSQIMQEARQYRAAPGQDRFESAMERAVRSRGRVCTTPEEIREVRIIYAYAKVFDELVKDRVGTNECTISVDHIIPVSRGGDTLANNLQVVRRADDLAKGSRRNVELESFEVPQAFRTYFERNYIQA